MMNCLSCTDCSSRPLLETTLLRDLVCLISRASISGMPGRSWKDYPRRKQKRNTLNLPTSSLRSTIKNAKNAKLDGVHL